MNGPWCIGGEFNFVLSLEYTSGSLNLEMDTRRFSECIRMCMLHDLGSTRQAFTWQQGNIRRRLDRPLFNLQ